MTILVASTSTDELHPERMSSDARPGAAPSVQLLVAVGIGIALGRWLFAANRTVVHAFPDGVAQLAMARWIAGGTQWSMLDHSTWQPGLAILIAPVDWLTDDPSLVFRAAIVTNCLLAGISAGIGCRLIHRLTELPART